MSVKEKKQGMQHCDTKHCVITGGNRGIGFAVAQRLGALGYSLTLIARDKAALSKAKKELEKDYKVPVHCAVADLTKARELTKAFESARKQNGEIHVLVNNAGQAESKPFLKIATSEWQQILDVNLTSVFWCCQNVLPDMLAKKCGRIISIASTAGVSGYPYVAAYCAAKHGLIGLTRSLALEVASAGVTVNAVCPGFTDTDLLTRAIKDVSKKTGRTERDVKAMYLAGNPQKRFVLPNEVASAVAWLCMPEQRAVTGQSIVVSGGEILK